MIPVKVTKVTSNDDWPLIYLPKEAIVRLGLRKGTKIVIYINSTEKSLIIKPIEAVKEIETERRGCMSIGSKGGKSGRESRGFTYELESLKDALVAGGYGSEWKDGP